MNLSKDCLFCYLQNSHVVKSLLFKIVCKFHFEPYLKSHIKHRMRNPIVGFRSTILIGSDNKLQPHRHHCQSAHTKKKLVCVSVFARQLKHCIAQPSVNLDLMCTELVGEMGMVLEPI